MKWNKVVMLVAAPVLFAGCAGMSGVDDSAGRATLYEDVSSPGAVSGVGIESQDIASMTDRMLRDMLAYPALAGRNIPPNVIIDEQYFKNESSSVINKKLITERLLVNLNRSAAGRMVFVERAAAEMVENERALKRKGVTTDGALGRAEKTAGADYRLAGSIMSLDTASNSTSMVSRYHQVSFKMVDLETGVLVWSGMYEFKKSAQDDLVYR